MASIQHLAKSIAQSLAAHDAVVSLAPEYDLKEIETMRIVVVPTGVEYKPVARTAHEENYKISIGILKRTTEDELDALIDFSTSLGQSFLNRVIDDSMCINVAHEPLYSPEHLREKNQFTSVIALTFKSIVRENPH